MKFAWAILLFALAADAATIPTNSARVGNYSTNVLRSTNYLLGATHLGSNAPVKLFTLQGADLSLGAITAAGAVVNQSTLTQQGIAQFMEDASFANNVEFTGSAAVQFLGPVTISSVASNRPVWLKGDGAVGTPTNMLVIFPPVTATVLSNWFWNLPNDCEAILAPGDYPVPLLGSGGVNPPPAFVLPNKTNLTIRAYGARFRNSSAGVIAGHMFYLSNFYNIKFLGGTYDGGGIVDTNAGTPGLFILDRGGDGFTLRDATVRGAVKGVKAWANTPSFTNLWLLYNRFEQFGDTNWAGPGGIDGSAIEAFGNGIWIIGNTFRLTTRAIEIWNEPNQTVYSKIYIAGNHIIDQTADTAILFLGNVPAATHLHVTIADNTFSNAPNARMTGQSSQAIAVQSATLLGATITGNRVSGDFQDFFSMNGSGNTVIGCTFSDNIVESQYNGIRAETTGVFNYNIISGNQFSGQLWRAIWVQGSGNLITDNAIRNVNTSGGFVLHGAIWIGPASVTATNNAIWNNSIIDDQGSPTIRSGIEFAANTSANYVGPNFYSRLQTNVHNLGTNMIAPRPISEGTATLSSGLATVNTVRVHANSRIMLTARATANAVSGVGVTNVVNGTSFQIRSESSADANRVDWVMMEPQ